MTERRLIGLSALGLLVLASPCVDWMRVAVQTIDATTNADGVHFEGFTDPEARGRWTSSNEPRLRFDRPLPREMTLRLSGHASAAIVGQDIVVRVPGGSAQVFRFSSIDSTQELKLTNPWLASAITWIIPHSQGQAGVGPSDDRREPGIAITQLEVLP